MAIDSIHLKGFDGLNDFLQTLAPKLEQNIMRSALRDGAKVIRDEAKANVPVKSGELRDSLKVSTSAKRGGKVTASVKTKVFYAKFVEYGTSAHGIVAKGGGWLSFGGVFTKSASHPGAKPRPFLRPAFDSSTGAALVAIGERIRARLTKEGINVPDSDTGEES